MTPRGRLRHGWARIGGSALAAGAKVFLVCLLVFLALDVLPGDAASGQPATAEQAARLREQYGLDRPVLVRFGDWLGGLVSGDLGTVLVTGTPVAEVIGTPVTRTVALLVLAGIGVAVLGVGGGVVAGLRAERGTDRALSLGALAVICTPEFVLGTVLVLVFAVALRWFPAVSLVPPGGTVWTDPVIVVLPAVAIMLVGSGVLLRQVRSVVARQNQTVHVESARLAGLTEARVVFRHVLPGAAAPIGQAVAAVVPYLVGGSVVIETVFAFPGLGSLLVQSVRMREPDLVMVCAMITVTVTVIAYALADVTARAPERQTARGREAAR